MTLGLQLVQWGMVVISIVSAEGRGGGQGASFLLCLGWCGQATPWDVVLFCSLQKSLFPRWGVGGINCEDLPGPLTLGHLAVGFPPGLSGLWVFLPIPFFSCSLL